MLNQKTELKMVAKSKEIPQMITLDFDFDIKNMRDVKLGNAGKTVAHCLESVNVPGLNAEKATDWADHLYSGQEISVDKSDYKIIKKWLTEEENRALQPIARRRFIEFFETIDKKSNL